MARIIPNQNSWIGFTTSLPANYTASLALSSPASIAVTEAELDAATNLTPFIVSINAAAQGNTIPIPALDSLFDRSISGTVQASFQADLYRDAAADTAWNTLARGTNGCFLISRFGGTGTNKVPRSTQTVEVWPVSITQRAGSQMTSNTAQTFQITAAVTDPPAEGTAVSVSTATAPSVPLNLAGYKEANGIVVLDWDNPAFLGYDPTNGVGLNTTTPFKIYQGASQVAVATGGTAISSNFTQTGTTARITGLTTGTTYWFGVEPQNKTTSPLAGTRATVQVTA